MQNLFPMIYLVELKALSGAEFFTKGVTLFEQSKASLQQYDENQMSACVQKSLQGDGVYQVELFIGDELGWDCDCL